MTSPKGSNAPAIPEGQSLQRRIDRGCATLLEAIDDTNDGAADFVVGRPHAAQQQRRARPRSPARRRKRRRSARRRKKKGKGKDGAAAKKKCKKKKKK